MNYSQTKRIQKYKALNKNYVKYDINHILTKFNFLNKEKLNIVKAEFQEWEYFLGKDHKYLKGVKKVEEVKFVEPHLLDLALNEIFGEKKGRMFFNIIVN